MSHAIELTTHTGTHVDAPAHFVQGGATVDEIPVDRLVSEYRVADLRSHSGERITDDVLADALGDLEPAAAVLLVTGDVDDHFHDESFFDRATVLTVDAAEWLVDHDVRVVANDFLTESIDGPDRPVHHALLEADIPIVEYVCNTDAFVHRDTVGLYCLPLALPGLEAAPARVVATDEYSVDTNI